MLPRNAWKVAVATAVAAAFVSFGHGGAGVVFVDGPPLGVTGGSGEPSCHQCHFDNELNAPGGSIDVRGLPDVFAPGEGYRLTVTLARKDLETGGFQMTARFLEGKDKGLKAGELRAAEERATVIENERRTMAYAQHTRMGTRATAVNTLTWRVDWIAPKVDGAVVFNVAAVAADGDISPFGDNVYLGELITASRRR
jgi:hypothetical protein